MEALKHKSLSHEDLGDHFYVDWLKAHEAHFSRVSTLEIAREPELLTKTIFCPINYKLYFRNILYPNARKYRSKKARIRTAVPTQLRIIVKFPDPQAIGLPLTGYSGPELAQKTTNQEEICAFKIAKAIAAYDRADPGAARIIIKLGLRDDHSKMFWPETLLNVLPGAELNQMLIFILAIRSKTQ